MRLTLMFFIVSEQSCRDRWRNIRCCFVRGQKLNLCGIPKKPYYLSDHLSFLIPYTKPNCRNIILLNEPDNGECSDEHSNTMSFIDGTESNDVSISPDTDEAINNESDPMFHQEKRAKVVSDPEDQEEADHDGYYEESIPVEEEKKKHVPKRNHYAEQRDVRRDDTDMLFLRSLHEDLQQLDGRRKRAWKMKAMGLLDELIDQQTRSNVSVPLKGRLSTEISIKPDNTEWQVGA